MNRGARAISSVHGRESRVPQKVVDSFFGFGCVSNASIVPVQKVVDLGQRVVDLFFGFDDGAGGVIDVIE